MTNLRAFLSGCSIVAFEKLGIRYAMACSWATMVDYDKILLCLGGDGETALTLQVGTYLGVSSLAKGQASIAKKMGNSHSSEGDKFVGIPYLNDRGALLIKGAKVTMECTVLEKRPFGELPDYLVILQVEAYQKNDDLEFLSRDDVK